MGKAKRSGDVTRAEVLKAALALPGVERGLACAGTALEAATGTIGGKAFVFVGKKEIRLKLDASMAAFQALAKAEPGRFSAGAGGWVAIKYDADGCVPGATRDVWVGESLALFAAAKSKPSAPRAKPARRKSS